MELVTVNNTIGNLFIYERNMVIVIHKTCSLKRCKNVILKGTESRHEAGHTACDNMMRLVKSVSCLL